jgi:hypothetical protein
MQRHKRIDILVKLGGIAGDAILEARRGLSAAQFAAQFMTVFAA